MNDADFEAWLARAWDEHAGNPEGVLARLQADAQALLHSEARRPALLHLAHHVCGEHLGRWQEGLDLLQRLSALPADAAGGTADPAAARFISSLALAGGIRDGRDGLSVSDRIRVTALAAASLAAHDGTRAHALLQEALVQFDAARLPPGDPCTRALAASSNNLAATLEERPQRSAEEVALMLLAAQSARRFWAVAGTWLETERAEYRLAMSWLKAGSPQQACAHARQCLAIVQAQPEPGAPALEHFFAWEAVGKAEHAAGNQPARSQALQQAQAWFDKLDASDAGWCRASLEALNAQARIA